MVFNSPFRIFTGDDEEMVDVPEDYELPRDVIVWRLSFDEDVDEFHIFYHKVATHALPTNSWEAFEGYLKRIVDNNGINWRSPNEGTPGETPLSIAYDGLAFMVLVVRDKKWRFSVTGAPFTIQKGKTEYYLHPRCAWRERNGEFKVGKTANGGVDCTTAFFVANAAKDKADNGHGGTFATSFNIFLELSMRRRGGRRTVPIVIDPDVGYPEGIKPDP
jgi:hypothetical protein